MQLHLTSGESCDLKHVSCSTGVVEHQESLILVCYRPFAGRANRDRFTPKRRLDPARELERAFIIENEHTIGFARSRHHDRAMTLCIRHPPFADHACRGTNGVACAQDRRDACQQRDHSQRSSCTRSWHRSPARSRPPRSGRHSTECRRRTRSGCRQRPVPRPSIPYGLPPKRGSDCHLHQRRL